MERRTESERETGMDRGMERRGAWRGREGEEDTEIRMYRCIINLMTTIMAHHQESDRSASLAANIGTLLGDKFTSKFAGRLAWTEERRTASQDTLGAGADLMRVA